MNQRLLTAAILAPLAIAAILWLPTPAFLVLAAALLLLGLWEWTRLVGLPSRPARAAVLVLHAAAFAALAWWGWKGLFPWVTLLGVAWWCAATVWLARMEVGSARNRGNRWLKLGIGSLLVVPAWCAAALLHGENGQGPAWTLFALGIVWIADSGAWFFGRRIGGPKLAPRISPGKTWAGFWGGLGSVAVLVVIGVPLLGLSWAQSPALLLAGVLTALASVVGDLFESLIKRHSGEKDSGTLVPGHGGVLDRIDSVLAALPVFAIAKAWLLP